LRRAPPDPSHLLKTLGPVLWRDLLLYSQRTDRRFPPPWTIERLPGGFKVIDANGQSLAYFYARENDHDANTAGVLTMDEARRMAINFARLPELLTR
jgi:hypothetical protein